MTRIGFLSGLLLVLGGVAFAEAQIVPQQKAPPFFKGEKRPKDEEGKTRSLKGVVRNAEDQPADGAVVQLKDTKTLQVRSFITKEDGKYHFHGLSTDVDYQVKATQNGETSEVKTLSVFDSRKDAVINLKIERKQ